MFTLADTVATHLNANRPVALGIECPLFVPIMDEPVDLTRARPGEGARPWCAGAGAGALATGLAQTVWLLRQIARLLESKVPAYVDWPAFVNANCGLFLWEAFVSSLSKADSHVGDADLAVKAFVRSWPNPEESNAVRCGEVYSLVGAALLRTEWSADPELLSTPCIVIKA